MKRKFNLIALTNLISGALVIYGIKVLAKLDGITHQMKPKYWFESKKKARPKDMAR